MMPSAICKRDGRIVGFDPAYIAAAIGKSLHATGTSDDELARELGEVVAEHLARSAGRAQVDIEEVQDAVIHVLQETGHYDAAIAYVRYRDERERRRREAHLSGTTAATPHLLVHDGAGQVVRWETRRVTAILVEHLGLEVKDAAKVLPGILGLLAEAAIEEVTLPMLLSLADVALIRAGMASAAKEATAARISAGDIAQALTQDHGPRILGQDALRQWSLARCPRTVQRLYSASRLWVDGLDDPTRGSQVTVVAETTNNPWQVLTQAMALACDLAPRWRRRRLILPPSILGHLERGAQQLLPPLKALSRQATVFLCCDGRTPLLETWPLAPGTDGPGVSVATGYDDFLVLRQLQELGLPSFSGPQVTQPGWRSAVAVELAVSAHGLDGDFAALDGLAHALVEAAVLRRGQLADRLGEPAEYRYAIFGAAAHTPTAAWLDRQIQQESERIGIPLRRSTNLSEAACTHLGRGLDG